jgi:hypothetical protein
MIGERKRYASFAREDALHLHNGKEGGKVLLIAGREIEGCIAIGSPEDVRPGGGVKKGVPGCIEDEIIPVLMFRGIDDLHLMHRIL